MYFTSGQSKSKKRNVYNTSPHAHVPRVGILFFILFFMIGMLFSSRLGRARLDFRPYRVPKERLQSHIILLWPFLRGGVGIILIFFPILALFITNMIIFFVIRVGGHARRLFNRSGDILDEERFFMRDDGSSSKSIAAIISRIIAKILLESTLVVILNGLVGDTRTLLDGGNQMLDQNLILAENKWRNNQFVE